MDCKAGDYPAILIVPVEELMPSWKDCQLQYRLWRQRRFRLSGKVLQTVCFRNMNRFYLMLKKTTIDDAKYECDH